MSACVSFLFKVTVMDSHIRRADMALGIIMKA